MDRKQKTEATREDAEALREIFLMIQLPHPPRLLPNYFTNNPTLGKKLGLFNKKSLVNLLMQRPDTKVNIRNLFFNITHTHTHTHAQIHKLEIMVNSNPASTITHF